MIEGREKVAAPITRELGKVGQQITDIDKRQDEMLGQLRENQNAMIQYLPQLAIRPPESLPSLAAPPGSLVLEFEVPKFKPEFLAKYRLPNPSYLLNEPQEDLESLSTRVGQQSRSITNDADANQLGDYGNTIKAHIHQLSRKSQPTISGYHNPVKTPRTYDVDKLYDKQCQNTYDLPSANEFQFMAKDKLEMISQKVTTAQKSVGGRKRAAKSTEQVVKLDEDLAL